MGLISKIGVGFSNAYLWVVGILGTTFGLAQDKGLNDTVFSMIGIFTLVFFLDWFTGMMKGFAKGDFTSKRNRKGVVTKTLGIYTCFFVFYLLCALALNIGSVEYTMFYCVLWTFTVIVTANELYSILENLEDLGVGRISGLKRVLDDILKSNNIHTDPQDSEKEKKGEDEE